MRTLRKTVCVERVCVAGNAVLLSHLEHFTVKKLSSGFSLPLVCWILQRASLMANVLRSCLTHLACGNRFSESLNTVKDVAEKSISEDYDSLIKNTAKSVESDMSHDFKSYGHHMWNLK